MSYRAQALIFLTILFSMNLNAQVDVRYDEGLAIGDEFSREFVSVDNISKVPEALRHQLEAVSMFGVGSAVYIGSQQGKHYMLTAAHTAEEPLATIEKIDKRRNVAKNKNNYCYVYPEMKEAGKREFHLGLLNVYYDCVQLVYINHEFDLAIFEVDPMGQEIPEPVQISKASTSFDSGDKLALFSYSSYKNIGTRGVLDMAFTTDNDCRVFESWESRNVYNDKKIVDESSVKLNTIPVGCDFVGGDSGGPLFNYNTGELIGLVSAGLVKSLKQINGQSDLYNQYVNIPEPAQKTIAANYLNQMVVLEPLVEELQSLNLID